MKRSWIAALAVVLLASVPSLAAAQMSRVGPTFTVNRLANGNTTPVRFTDVSFDSSNRVYLVVWGAFGEILGRFVASDGSVLGVEPFVIAAPGTASDYKDAPRVEFSPDAGAFMVTWRDNRTDPNAPTVWARSLAYAPSTGLASFLTSDFMVTGAFVHFGDVPVLSYSTVSHEFLIVYNRDYDVRARRFDINGNLLGGEIILASTPNGIEYAWQANVTYNSTKNEFFVVWRWFSDTLMAGAIQARRVQAGSDNLIGATLEVDPPSGFDLAIPSVAYHPGNDRYLVVWYRSMGGLFTFAGRLMNGDGTAAGSRFTLAPTANYVDLDVDFSSRIGSFFAVYAHHDLIDIFGTRVSAAGVADAMDQVTVTAAVTGTDYGRVASATDRDEWLVTSNIWWNKAIAQRMTFNSTGITLSKQSPVLGASGLASPVTLTWDSVAGGTYEYCIDTSNNSTCNTSWQSAASASASAALGNGTYFWQVRVTTAAGTAEANSGGWWSFTIGGVAPFSKQSPSNGVSGLASSVSLSWAPVTGASYEVCVDTSNNGTCDAAWTAVGGTSTGVTLGNGTYYWQVRATTSGGTGEANSGTWWTFTVGATPALFNKQSPANGSSGVASPTSFSWSFAPGASSYQICIDTIADNSCNTSWQDAGGSTSAVSALGAGTYSWQVRAFVGGTPVLADNGVAGSFTVGGGGPPPPPPAGGPFGKSSVANGASGLGSSVTLQWQGVSDAGFRVCWDTTNNNSCDAAWWPNGGGTSRNLNDLAPGTYYWQVRAETSSSTTDADSGTWWTFTVGAAAPPPPPPPPAGGVFGKQSPVNGATGSGDGALLIWGAASGATFYQVCVDTANNNSCDTNWLINAQSVNFGATGLAPGTYYWQVRGLINGSLVEADSGAWSAFTLGGAAPLPPPPPPPPTGGLFGKTGPANGSADPSSQRSLQWQAVSDAGYRVCWDTTNNNACDTVWWPNGGGTVRNIDSLASGTYYWQVRAETSSGAVEADSGVWFSFTVGSVAPPPPPPVGGGGGGGAFAKLAPSNGSADPSSSRTLQWQAVSDAGYRVCWDTTNNNSCDATWWPNGGGTARNLEQLANGTYYWQVRAETASGAVEFDGGAWYSFTVGSVAPPPPPPPVGGGGGAFAKTSPGQGSVGMSSSVVVQWSAVADAGYSVCWDLTNNNACDGAWFPNGAGTSRTLTGLTPGTYYWQVRAQTSGGTVEADSGAWSSFAVTTAGSVLKIAPASGASTGGNVTLQWTTLADAGFWVCWDTSNNNNCDSVWWPNGGGNSRNLQGLAPGTYYWQVRVQTAAGETQGDGGTWATFTVTGLESLSASVDALDVDHAESVSQAHDVAEDSRRMLAIRPRMVAMTRP